MINKNILKNEFNVDIAINDFMEQNISLWINMYQNKPPWINENIKSMQLPGAIANEIARLVTIEFKSEISNNDFLNEEYQKVLKNLKINCEYACAAGGIVFKPYFNNGIINVDIVTVDNFYPISYQKDKITEAIFIETKIIGNKEYTRVEYHSINNYHYTIKNTAFVKNIGLGIKSNNLGKQVSLDTIPDWVGIEEEVNINNIDRPLFSLFKIPLANPIDTDSPLGVSVYSKAVDLIKEADKQYSRILWEYEGTELAIDADINLFKINKTTKEPELPSGKERLFRTYEFEDDNKDNSLKTFSPEIRDSSLFNGLNNLLRRIEFNCGLAYGTLSDINDTDKTATEIKASKQRSYSTVKDIQKSLQESLTDLATCLYYLCKLYKIPVGNFNKKDMSFDWDDSIILDKDTELAAMREDVAAGILKPEIYLSKKYGVSEKEAKNLMPGLEKSLDTKSPYDGLEE